MSTRPANAVAQSRAIGSPPVSRGRCSLPRLARGDPAPGVEGQVLVAGPPARRHRPRVLVVEVALLRRRDRVLVPGVVLRDRVPQGVLADEHLLVLTAPVEGAAQEDADAEVDLNEVG